MSKRKALSLSQKISLLKDVDSGMRNKELSRKYDIAPSSVSTILSKRKSIEKLFEVSGDSKKRSRGCKYDDIDEAVLQWVKMVRDQNFPVSGPLIKEKAAEYAQLLGHEDFQASSGWLDKFKKRHGIIEKVISGESGDVNKANVDEWKKTILKSILDEYEPKDIFNADETGLFFKCLPNKTLSFKDDKCLGGKNSKERVTVMVGTNMTGSEKLKLLVIGKSKQPRCFKGVKTLEVDYDYNKKSWMTSNIFENWIMKLDKKMVKQKRKIAMIIDNCPAHPPSVAPKLKNIKLLFFPPNVTSILQPMDQGVIKNLKVHYRKRILIRLIRALESGQPVSNIINLRTCISEFSKVWENDVKETTIKNCFAKAGFIQTSASDTDELDELIGDDQHLVEEAWNELLHKGVMPDNVSLEEFLMIDEDVVITEYPTDEDILNSVRKNEPEENDVEEEENEENQIIKPSKIKIHAAFETLRLGFQAEDNVPDEIFKCLNKCEHFFEEISVKQLVQGDIRQFFQP